MGKAHAASGRVGLIVSCAWWWTAMRTGGSAWPRSDCQAILDWQQVLIPGIDIISSARRRCCTPHHERLCTAGVMCRAKAHGLGCHRSRAMQQAAVEADRPAGQLYQYRGHGRVAVPELIADGTWPDRLLLVDAREVCPKIAMHRRGGNGGPVHDMVGHFRLMMI